MKLYEIENAILECIDTETGEVIDIERLNELQMERETKIENVACWIKDLKAEAEAIKAEKQKLADRQRVAENKAESLKNWLAYALDGQKFSTARCAVSFRKSESLEVSEEAKIPEEFLRYKEPEINKADLKKAVKAGLVLDGVQLVEKSNISIK